MDPNFEDFASNIMMCKGRVENRPMGQCLWDIRRNSLLQRERKVWTCWGTIPQIFAEAPGGSGSVPAEGHCMASAPQPSHPSPLSGQGWTHKGSELTELN